MAAFTEGFTYHGNNINIVSKVLAARAMAKRERDYAAKKLSSQQEGPEEDKLTLEDFGIKKGYFFKKALKHEFGGDLYLRKKEKLDDIIKRAKLLKNPRKNFSQLFEKRKKTSKVSRFRSQFDYNFIKSDEAVEAKSETIPSRAKKIQKATTGSGKRLSREQLLSSIEQIVNSIEAVAASIESSSNEVGKNIVSSNLAQANIAEQLKTRNDTLADKLDKIAAAISNQTQYQKQSVEKQETAKREQQLENQADVARTSSFDDLTTEEDESKEDTNTDQDITPTTSITNIQNLIPATSAQRAEMAQMDAYNTPQLERGGIVSGPDSGYLAKLHGDEMVIPLDNNYTQGEPSAVDGKVKPRPKIQKFERGTSIAGSKFGFGNRPAGIGTGAQLGVMSQPLVDAMSLPMMAAGGSVIAATSQLMSNLGPAGNDIKPELEKFSRPVADVFGVPATVERKAKGSGVKLAKREAEKKGGEKEGPSNILENMKEGFKKLLESFTKKIDEIEPTPPPPGGPSGNLLPGDAPAEVKALMETISGGEGGPNSVQGIGEVDGLSDMTIDDAIAKAKSYIGKGSSTGALGAFQFHSSYLRERAQAAGLDPSKEKFTMENQTKIMRNFMTQVWTSGGGAGGEAGLVKALKSGDLEGTVFPKLSKDFGWPSLPGGSQQNVHSAGSGQRYKKHLAKYQQATTTPTSPTATKGLLGQQITENYGMDVHDKFYFKLGGTEYHAYKTTKGFDFYKGSTKVTDPTEEQKVIQGFVNLKTQALNKPSTQQASLLPPNSREKRSTETASALTSTKVDGSSIAMLNLISPQSSAPKMLNSPQPSASTVALTESGNPLHNSGLYLTG